MENIMSDKILGIYIHNMSERSLKPSDFDEVVSQIIDNYGEKVFSMYFSKWSMDDDYISNIFGKMGYKIQFVEPSITYNLEDTIILHYFLLSATTSLGRDLSVWLNDYLREWEKGVRLFKSDTRRNRLIKILFI